MSFPVDDYTPYGYLANPAARATAFTPDGLHGGSLRTATDVVGLGWSYPWDRRPLAAVELVLRLESGERRYVSRDEWSQIGLHASYHSAHLFSFNWSAADTRGEWRLLLADPDTLLGILELHNEAPFRRDLRLDLLARVRRQEGEPDIASQGASWRLLPGAPAPPHTLHLLELTGGEARPLADDGGTWGERSAAAGYHWSMSLAPGETARLVVALGRGPALANSLDWVAAERAARQADADFYATAPRLAGDWPADWRRGWIYDLETTRFCLQPPGGIFADIWPTWMVHWPRAVVAEGTLDMLRLGYAAPGLAQRAILTLFRDAPAPNVPCVFQGGEPNMIARDGSVCGTSPAWCLPFPNIQTLYRWTLDRDWLAALYPYLAAYLRWWLTERVDGEGWIVYRCTWEAGEDNSPRLDPAGEGDHVITEFTRPVELQAMLAVSAAILAGFAAELDDETEQAHWAAVARDYRRRARALWDETEGRFRDWDKRAGGFVQPTGRATYWDADPCRYSPLSLTPLLEGVATPHQAARLGAELPAYDVSPWADWPSWSYTIVESAAAGGHHAMAARMATRIVERVYRRNDRRDLRGFARPLPGVAPEYWPTDVATYTGSDGYGWGANTLALLLRHVIGFTESDDTGAWSFHLTPGLPTSLMHVERDYWLRNLHYRGRRLDLGYTVEQDGPDIGLRVTLRFEEPVHLVVRSRAGPGNEAASAPPSMPEPRSTHRFPVERGRRYQVILTTGEQAP